MQMKEKQLAVPISTLQQQKDFLQVLIIKPLEQVKHRKSDQDTCKINLPRNLEKASTTDSWINFVVNP